MRALAVTAAAVAGGVLALPATASAEAPRRDGWSATGYDVSHPQCGTDLPAEAAFAVVGVNGGLATRPNRCLAEQLEWATRSTGGLRGGPAVELYVNTANPGQVRDQVTTWPRATSTPYGTCDGGNTMACSWVYGRIRAQVTVHAFFQPAARAAGIDDDPAAYRWWLDVETMNTWQAGSTAALERNRATLEGQAAYLQESGAEVGLYSTGQQWRRIVGEVGPDSLLHDLDSWLAGARSRAGALQNCAEPPLTDGGRVVLAQYVEDGLDHDVPCGRDRPRR